MRRAVFIDEQGVSEALELDADDHQYTHALAVSDGGDAIATGRLAGAQIGRMAVLESWRGRGVGKAILRCLIAAAGARNLRRVTLNAQVHAQTFYAANGFVADGEIFMEAGIAHIKMTRDMRT